MTRISQLIEPITQLIEQITQLIEQITRLIEQITQLIERITQLIERITPMIVPDPRLRRWAQTRVSVPPHWPSVLVEECSATIEPAW